MRNKKRNAYFGIDLFAGAGGMTLGARKAGVKVFLGIENESKAAWTYAENNPATNVLIKDVTKVKSSDLEPPKGTVILFGGPPCQGFSTSNQRTRGRENPLNWLTLEFIRLAESLAPDWIIFENVIGIMETAGGFFIKRVERELKVIGYACTTFVLCASDFGVPQFRKRFFLVGSKHNPCFRPPKPSCKRWVTVKEAISDLPSLGNGADQDYMEYPLKAVSRYAQHLRKPGGGCSGHLVTKNAPKVIERYRFIPQGGNWENIPNTLMGNYKDHFTCHTGLYRRLQEDLPAVVLGNYRKSMLIHPWENRGLSVREAARLQSFPDQYSFHGSIGFQQQQVANAVPPLLAEAVFREIVKANENLA